MWQKLIKNDNKQYDTYIAHKVGAESDDYGNEIELFDKPFKCDIGAIDMNSYTDLMVYGAESTRLKKAVLPIRYKTLVREGDRAYLEGASPKGEEYNGSNGNYRVRSAKASVRNVVVIFEKLV